MKKIVLGVLIWGIFHIVLPVQWQLEFVDGDTISHSTGQFNHIAVDSDGHPHITYVDWTLKQVKYAYRGDSSWSVQYVDSGVPVSIKTAKTKYPSIGYEKDKSCRCARWDGIRWDTLPELSGLNPPGEAYIGDASLDLDSLNHPCMAYDIGLIFYIDLLRYAFWNGNTWAIQTVDSTQTDTNGFLNQYQWSISLRVNSLNQPRIAADFTHNGRNPYREVRYIQWDGVKWHIETVADTGGSASLDLDSQNCPHIAYIGVNHKDHTRGLIHAFYNGSLWEYETVDTLYPFGETIKLRIDSKDRPHIAYSQPLRYAFWDGKTWQRDTVAGEVGWGDLDMDLDSQDNPHISYYGTHQGKTGAIYAKGTPEGIEEKTKNTIAEKDFIQIYPNPFGQTVTIRYQITKSGFVSLKIYDATGELVRIFPEEKNAGRYVINWNGRDNKNRPLPNGIYFVKFETNDSSTYKKVVLVR